MAKGYWVVHLDVTDATAYQRYRDFVQPFLDANNGRFLIRGGMQEVTEGQMRSRTVIVEFPSFDIAKRAYHSAEYAEGKALRTPISEADFAIVEGYEG